MRERGFTFVELMIVVAIVGVLALVGTPTLKDMMPAVRVNAAARELATELQSARMRAVTKRAEHRVTFDTTNHTFTLCRCVDATCTTCNVIKTVAIKAKYQNAVVFGYAPGANDTSGDPITSAVTFTAYNVIFRPFGTANKNGTVYLMPAVDVGTGRKDRMRALTVLLQTGRVKLWKYNTAGSWSAS